MHTGTFPSIAITSSLYGSPLVITLSKSNYNPETKCKFVPCQHSTPVPKGAFCHSYVKIKHVAMQTAYTYIYERISRSEEYTELCCYRMPLLQLLLQSGMASQPESTT